MGDQAQTFVKFARQMIVENSYSKALGLFFLAFKKNPSLLPTYETEYCSILLKHNNVLAEQYKFNTIFRNFKLALQFYPQNLELLNEVGKYLYKFGYYKEAWERFKKVLKINPNMVNAEANLNSVKNMLVERWHFRMLNDNIRNECYRKAIHQTVQTHNERVLDVGTGTGLLAIYAHEAGATKVIGCDRSKVMCNLADSIVQGNKIHNIRILNQMSTDLSLWDMGGKCSVLLTEMFDAGLFGELVLQMLSDAWLKLLTENAIVVPKSAEFFVVGAESDQLIRNYQLCLEAKELLDIESFNVHVLTNEETYDCEDVHLIKDIKYITEPQSLVKINFNDLKDINESLERIEPYKTKLKAKESGQVNVVVGWFNLYLSDNITVTTDPLANDKASAWQQAVFFDDIPRTVQENETINIDFLMNGGKLTMVNHSDSYITRASQEIIAFLNDTEYVKMIMSSLSMACVYLEQIAEISTISMADLCPFPLFGLQMLKRGARSLLCCAKNGHDKEFIVQVFRENNVAMENVTIICGDDWTTDIFDNEQFHVIFGHSLEMWGDVDLRMSDNAVFLKRLHLVEGGLYLPAHVTVVAQLVSSHWLDLNNRLYDKNVSDYKMATYFNKYQVTQNFCINFDTLKYVPISNPVELCSFPDSLSNESASVPVISDGFANAILCWYNIKLMEDLNEISTNRANSFINGMLFLTYSKRQLVAGEVVQITQYKDLDGCFKLVMEPSESS